MECLLDNGQRYNVPGAVIRMIPEDQAIYQGQDTADAGSASDISKKNDRTVRDSHVKPVRNMALMPSFFVLGSCSPHTAGRGITKR